MDTLSGGMQRRLNIVASVLHQPNLIMLDEPTVGVDVNARERIHELLRRLRADGLGILLTTHDLLQATTLADRVIFLVAGQVRLEGAPDALIRQKCSASTRKSPLPWPILPGSGSAPVAHRCQPLSRARRSNLDRQRGPRLRRGDRLEPSAGGHGPQRCGNPGSREPSLEGVFLRLTGEELVL